MNNQKYIKLNNGVEMPMAGIGTFLLTPDEAEASVISALQTGYRLIDTANAYVNEKAVGRAIKKSGVPRKEIFLETKLWPSFYEQNGCSGKDTEAVGYRLHRFAVDPSACRKLYRRIPPDGAGIQGGQSTGHRSVQLHSHSDSGDSGHLRSETCYFADGGTSVFSGAEAERIPGKRKYGHSGMVSTGTWGQGADSGASIFQTGGEIWKEQCPDYPALAHSGRKRGHSRFQESGSYPCKL